MSETNIDGAIAAALAKAQAAFPAIARDKEVTVTSKSGSSYKFKYAPLESILSAVREPLSSNGLAIVQLLDDGDLVTMLLHDSGARLAGRVSLPAVDGLQAFGSAITYLRRYSIQAILGIATEEDDDGNHASGNSATFGGARPAPPRLPAREDPASADPPPGLPPYAETEELIGRKRVRGIIRKGSAEHYKLESRQGPDGHVIGFRLEVGPEKHVPQCLVAGPLGEALFVATGAKPTVLAGIPSTVAGILYYVKTNREDPDTGRSVSWYRMHVDRIETTINGLDVILPADIEPDLPAPPDDVSLVGEAESKPLGLVS